MNNKIRVGATHLLAFSIFTLAAALIYFTVAVARISQQIPDILSSIKSTSAEIRPVVVEIDKIRDLIPPIINEVAETRKHIPQILKEIQFTREQIPSILEEVKLIREQIPSILEEVQNARGQLPSILKSVDNASAAMTQTASEIKAARPLIPQVLKEVEKTREEIPKMLDHADRIVSRAQKAGQEASQGAVTGFFTGIIMTPFTLIGNVFGGLSSEDAADYNDEDKRLFIDANQQLIAQGQVGDSREWRNLDSGNRGKNILKANEEREGRECRVVQVQIWNQDELDVDKEFTACKNEDGVWEMVK